MSSSNCLVLRRLNVLSSFSIGHPRQDVRGIITWRGWTACATIGFSREMGAGMVYGDQLTAVSSTMYGGCSAGGIYPVWFTGAPRQTNIRFMSCLSRLLLNSEMTTCRLFR